MARPGALSRDHFFIANGQRHAAFMATHYVYPPGYSYRRFQAGEYFPAALFISSFIIVDYAAYNLQAPPDGSSWVRNGRDVVAVDTTTKHVEQTIPDVFDDSSAPVDADSAAD